MMKNEGMGSVISIKLPVRRNEKTQFSSFEGLRAKLALRKKEKPPYSISRNFQCLATGFYLKSDFHKTELRENNHKKQGDTWQYERGRS